VLAGLIKQGDMLRMSRSRRLIMNDRELLEWAAKAAKIDGDWVELCLEDGHPTYSCGIGKVGRITTLWNPLADDGDALRLAVKLSVLWLYMEDRFSMFQRFYLEELNRDLKPSEATGTAQTKQLLEKIEQLEAEVLARKLNPLNPFYDLEKDKDFRDNFERLASQGISKKQRGMILREVMRAIHAYAAESVRKAEAARHPAPVAAQESAPAELPIKTWQERAEESGADALTVDQCMKLAETEIAELRGALSRPVVASETQINAVVDKLRNMDAGVWSRGGIPQRELIASILDTALASPQPVAKVLSDSEIKMVAYGHRIGSEVAVKFARAILAAASTPTTLTEPGNGSQS
jgi:hypothetical protein